MMWWLWLLILLVVLLVVVIYDLTQRQHAILRNFPLIGHLRYLIELMGPELRQYVVADNDEEKPFSRDERRWVYATAKKENSYFGFGSDDDLTQPNRVVFRHTPFPLAEPIPATAPIPCTKILGKWRERPGAFRPASAVNLSGMSFGSLSGAAIQALNRGAAIDGCLHNTGEGGLSQHHLHGGDLIFQFGTGYFGCRDHTGLFSSDVLVETISNLPVRAIEIKLSQGAKPGVGGMLPAAKVTKEIAVARNVPQGHDVVSPSAHSAFSDIPTLIEFVEHVADVTGMPVGIKSAVGQVDFWVRLARHMARTGKGPDFINVDGGEGGTGAGPLVFADHVALPFWEAFSLVHKAFADVGLTNELIFAGAGRLGLPTQAAMAMAMGVDMVNVGREAMLAIGCVQAQKCHTGHCPTGVATQSKWLERGLDPTDKAVRLANYMSGLRYELLRLSYACGVRHPALLGPAEVSVRWVDGRYRSLHDHYGVDSSVTHSAERVNNIKEALVLP
ncbi:MAG: FMN-binding glutamate synthase family protein [Acidimicrobiales bacterium]|nr:FMN-binding glutamate synthase family protein [Acidimicrobiales bacterium]